VVVDVVGIIEVDRVVVLVLVVIAIGVLEVVEDDPSIFILKHSQHLSGPVEQCPSNGSTSISISLRSSWRTSIHAPVPLKAARQEP